MNTRLDDMLRQLGIIQLQSALQASAQAAPAQAAIAQVAPADSINTKLDDIIKRLEALEKGNPATPE